MTDADSAAAELLARRLTNLKQVSNIDSLRMVRNLPDGGYVVAQDMGGNFRVIAHKPAPPPPEPPFEGVATPYIPMLFSGRIQGAAPDEDQGVGVLLTEICRRRLAGYGDDGLRSVPGKVELQRFRIPYHQGVRELEVRGVFGPLGRDTQYYRQRPTWYSGAMAEVMQIVGGYGRQDFKDLPDDPVEQARMVLPPDVEAKIVTELGNVRLPGYRGIPAVTGQFQYDYKFNRTHGVGFGADGKPWLIQVAPDAVHAMPLPLVPATTTTAFRDYIVDVGDTEIEAILDRFGGLPSGESFPPDEDSFEAWRRAGVIIEICDTEDFYDNLFYSVACGWSFNLSGTEGFNTCYDYGSDGIGTGLAYKLSLSLGAADGGGRLPPGLGGLSAGERREVDEYLAKLYRVAQAPTARNLAVKYKLRRATAGQILSRARAGAGGQGELAYWDSLEMDPIATHEGRVSMVGSGRLYGGGQIKFADPLWEGCISHVFAVRGDEPEKKPKCDTIMFGYYIEDDLKVVKYFYDPNDGELEVVDNYEECMIVGAWERTATSGKATIQGRFYTTDFDDRKLQAPTVTVEKIVGKDLGFDSRPWYSFAFVGWMNGTVWRNRYASRHVERETNRDVHFSSAICIPFFCRNAVVYATSEASGNVTNSEERTLVTVRDPNSYQMWTYDERYHYFPLLILLAGAETWANVPAEFFEEYALGWMDTRPMPWNSYPVYAEIHNYNPAPCSDFADYGSWINVPEVISDIVPQQHVTLGAAGGGPPKLRTYSWTETTDREYQTTLEISIDPYTHLLNEDKSDERLNINRLYFYNSPDAFGTVFYIDATKITFGLSSYSVVMESNGGPGFAHWGYTRLADHRSSPQFIGVINE